MSKADITVRVTEETWEALKDMKNHGDHYNDVIRRALIEAGYMEPA